MTKRFAAIAFFIMVVLSMTCTVLAEHRQVVVYFNGEPMEMRLKSNDMLSEYYDWSVQYVPFAKKAGYETIYNESENKVISTKGDDSISFVPGAYQVTIVKGGETQTVYGGSYEYEGSSYINLDLLDELFGYPAFYNYEEEAVHIYDKAALTQQIETQMPAAVSLLQQQKIPASFSSEESYLVSLKVDSALLQTSVTGKLGIDLNAKAQNGVFAADISINGEGLASLYELIAQAFLSTNSNFYQKEYDFDQPMQASFYWDDEALYVKSDVLVPIYLYSSLGWNITPEFKEQMAETVQGKWLKIEADDSIRQALEQVRSILYDEQKENTLPNTFADAAVNAKGAEGYQKVTAMVQFILELIGDDHFTLEVTDAGQSLNYHLNGDQLKELIKKYESLFPVEEISKWLDLLSFDIQSTVSRDLNQNVSSQASIKASLSNIPNHWQAQLLTVDLQLDSASVLKAEAQQMTEPEAADCIAYQEIMEERKNNLLYPYRSYDHYDSYTDEYDEDEYYEEDYQETEPEL